MSAGSKGDGGEVAASEGDGSEVGNLSNEGKVKRVMPPGCKMIFGDQPSSPVMRNREGRGAVRMRVQDGCSSVFLFIYIYIFY